MNFIALKPCCFAGKNFKIGETVPRELVLPEMQKRLFAMGKLAAAAAEDYSDPPKKPQKNKKQAVMKDGDMDV